MPPTLRRSCASALRRRSGLDTGPLAVRLLTRVRADSALRRWGLALKKRLGFKRAAVAVTRKMAVALHAMRRSGVTFDPDVPAGDVGEAFR